MNRTLRAISMASCVAALLAIAPLAHADTVSGSVWENASFFPNPLLPVPPAGTPSATFTLTTPGSASDFNFTSGTSNDLIINPTYSLSGFLTSGGDGLAYITGSSHGGDSINNDVFEFTGTTTLIAGQTYTINHDDGMILFINGVEVIDSGSPTASIPSSFIASASGTFSFDLLYAEVNGAPATLSGSIGSTAITPEPSSIVLLGSGLLAAAGAIRRRRTV
jgi:hypothetical protein